MITVDGLEGDRSRAGKRAVTLIQLEHLAAIGSYLGQRPIAPDILRRNLVVSGINLAALKGREVQVGEAILRFTVICAPCSRMEESLGKGGYSAVRGHGGWCAEVIKPGRVRLGDLVQPVD
ncbi:MOSC domain-containing protein [Ruegeria sp. ANG10]|uniref:MOSC domain-containing protein n=1 Tax=Ruegeria sp. ANG10 TaxID=3042467 RepID=UPI0034552CEF